MPRLLFVVTEDWYFVTHRLSLAIAARDAGYDVAVLTRVGRHARMIEEAGIRVIPFSLSRGIGNPVGEIIGLVRHYRHEAPDIVHQVALKPVAYGTLAALLAGVPSWINAVAGLGSTFSKRRGVRGKLRGFLRWALARLVDQGRSLSIVQNPDDRDALIDAGVAPGRLRLIRGAGVDTTTFRPGSALVTPPVVMLVSRMLWDKGVGEFVDAARRIKAMGLNARFVLVGSSDSGNASAVPEEQLRKWHKSQLVEWWGHQDNVADAYRQASIACLPSTYGEGIPKSLLEAAASGLPIVTTDGPGCREVVAHGQNGFLVPPKDVSALADALCRLLEDSVLRASFGARSRARAELEFAVPLICAQTLAVYREVMA